MGKINRYWQQLAFLGLTGLFVAVFILRLKQGQAAALGAATVSQAAVSSLPAERSQVDLSKLAAGLMPPTNKWFSSLVFSTQPQPIFAYPLSYRPTATGFEVDAPQVTATANTVFGAHRPSLVVSLGTIKSQVTAYDDLSVTDSQFSADGTLLTNTRITEGSPYIFVTAKQGKVITISSLGQISILDQHRAVITLGTQRFGIVTSASLDIQSGALRIRLGQDANLAIFNLPDSADESVYFNAANHPLELTTVDYRLNAKTMATIYTYRTTTGAPTLMVARPSTSVSGAQLISGVYPTLLGAQTVYSGSAYTVKQPTVTPVTQLDLAQLTSTERSRVITQLNQDTDNLSFVGTDTYAAGKELYRAANLLQLAEQLGETATANTLSRKLKDQLNMWYDPKGKSLRSNKFFYYDGAIHGIVGVTSSFGSEQFNDHHFHYGYFIYASAVLGKYDPSFVQSAAPMVNLLISDLASEQTTDYFPKLRYFDPYVGHSWAAGFSDFGDGNNQESSSEAINAWYSLYLWSLLTQNTDLSSQSLWLYSSEVQAATTQWLAPQSSLLGSGYTHDLFSLVWGGKLDYATFFSSDPAAILGIQLIPMSPGHGYLTASAQARAASLAATPAHGPFSDYLTMYLALANPSAATARAEALLPGDIDTANSLAYTLAWVYSER